MIDYKKRAKICSKVRSNDGYIIPRMRDNKMRLRLVTKYLKSGNILDVGYAMIPNPYLKSPVGFDLAKPLKLYPNYKYAKKGNINDGLPFADSSFDNIVAGEFIEHIENPVFFLKECHRVLKSGGRLIITTPNIYCYWKFFAGLLGLDKEVGAHLYEFAPQTLEKVLKICDFKILHREGVEVGIPFISRIFSFLKKVRFKPIYFCNTMLFVCKKSHNPDFVVEANKKTFKGFIVNKRGRRNE